uniref:Putative secreted protein n=1 Tax=Anopheles darlingi TaxID=43151 RepID=A0A2M4DPF3_ANODA
MRRGRKRRVMVVVSRPLMLATAPRLTCTPHSTILSHSHSVSAHGVFTWHFRFPHGFCFFAGSGQEVTPN